MNQTPATPAADFPVPAALAEKIRRSHPRTFLHDDGAPGIHGWTKPGEKLLFCPQIGYPVEVAVRRLGIALETRSAALADMGKDYNGHHVTVDYHAHLGCYTATYYWSGTHTLAGGSLERCVEAALAYYAGGALGAGVEFRVREADLGDPCLQDPRIQPWSREAELKASSKWFTWKHRLVNAAVNFRRVPELLEAETPEEFCAALPG